MIDSTSDPCWNDDWEQKYKIYEDEYKSLRGWNLKGRVIKKGSKGIYLSCARVRVFQKDETYFHPSMAQHFLKKSDLNSFRKNIELIPKTYQELFSWLTVNNGKYIKTYSKTWNEGFMFEEKNFTLNDMVTLYKPKKLFVLFRKNGIDLKILEENCFGIKEKLYTFKGGECLWMTFDASQFNLYREVFRIVKRFNRGAVGEILEIFESRRLELIQFKKEIARLNTD